MTLSQEANPLGAVVIAQCDLRLEGCTALTPAPVTIVKVGTMQDQFVVCSSCLETMIREGEWRVRGSRLRTRADFTLNDPLNHAVMAVEVKTTPRTRAVDIPRWAASLRRNLLAHAAVPSVPYFLLLVVPEAGYLWSNPEAPYDALPDYTIDLAQFTLPGDSVPEEKGVSAEAWTARSLAALVEGRLRPQGLWWTESGLGRAVENGDLRLTPGPATPVS